MAVPRKCGVPALQALQRFEYQKLIILNRDYNTIFQEVKLVCYSVFMSNFRGYCIIRSLVNIKVVDLHYREKWRDFRNWWCSQTIVIIV